jgi:hypothetical protein
MPYKDKEEELEHRRIYYREHKEEISSSAKKYYKKNKKELEIKAKIYRKDHKEDIHNKNRIYYREHKKNARELALSKLYGITDKDWNKLFLEQDGKCAICGRAQGKTRLHTDHSHITGKVRGLLCENCNHGLGNLKDNPDILRKAIEYLEKE